MRRNRTEEYSDLIRNFVEAVITVLYVPRQVAEDAVLATARYTKWLAILTFVIVVANFISITIALFITYYQSAIERVNEEYKSKSSIKILIEENVIELRQLSEALQPDEAFSYSTCVGEHSYHFYNRSSQEALLSNFLDSLRRLEANAASVEHQDLLLNFSQVVTLMKLEGDLSYLASQDKMPRSQLYVRCASINLQLSNAASVVRLSIDDIYKDYLKPVPRPSWMIVIGTAAIPPIKIDDETGAHDLPESLSRLPLEATSPDNLQRYVARQLADGKP